MSTNQRDYFEQKPGLDLKPFFESKGLKLDEVVPVSGVGAPPPKDTAWCAVPTDTQEETEQE